MPNLSQFDKDRIKNLIIKKDFKNFLKLQQEVIQVEEWGFIKVNKLCYIIKQLVKLRGTNSATYRDCFNRFLTQVEHLPNVIKTWWETYCQLLIVIKYNNHYCKPNDELDSEIVLQKDNQIKEQFNSQKFLNKDLTSKVDLFNKEKPKVSIFNQGSLFDIKPQLSDQPQLKIELKQQESDTDDSNIEISDYSSDVDSEDERKNFENNKYFIKLLTGKEVQTTYEQNKLLIQNEKQIIRNKRIQKLQLINKNQQGITNQQQNLLENHTQQQQHQQDFNIKQQDPTLNQQQFNLKDMVDYSLTRLPGNRMTSQNWETIVKNRHSGISFQIQTYNDVVLQKIKTDYSTVVQARTDTNRLSQLANTSTHHKVKAFTVVIYKNLIINSGSIDYMELQENKFINQLN